MSKADDRSADDADGTTSPEMLPPSSPVIEITATPPEGPEVQPAPPGGLKKTAVSGALWIGIGFGASYLVRIVSSMILTRLLVPQVYALMDIAMVFIQGLHMFADVGIGTSVIHSPRGDETNFLNTAWTMQILRGLVLWAATALIAWPVAALYDQPVLLYLMPAIGSTGFLDGLAATAVFTLRRRLARAHLVILELTSSVLGTCLTVAWVWWVRPDVWGFVVGSVATGILFTGLSHLALPGPRNRLRWDRSSVHELLGFGKWVFFSTIITFLAFQADRLILPKLSGLWLFGIYGRALSLAGIATGLMSTLSTQLVFPLYSRLRHQGRDIRNSFTRVHASAASFGAVLVTGMIGAGPDAVRVLYGSLFEQSGWMLQFLAVGAWFQILEGTTGASLMALGQPRSVTLANASRLLALPVVVPGGFFLGQFLGIGGPQGGGFVGMLIGFILADFIRYLMTIRMARQQGLSAVRYDIALSVGIALIGLAAVEVTDLLWAQPLQPEFLGAVRADFVGSLAVAPQAPFPESVPWASWVTLRLKDWRLLLGRLATAGGIVLGAWAVLFLLWRERERRRWRKVS
jgi:O-antigen/teichoic acid export membrane protein